MSAPAMEREHVVLGGDPVLVPLVQTAAGRAEWAAASLAALNVDECDHCGEEGHLALVRLYPRPDGHRPEAIDEMREVCSCCAFGTVAHPERGLLARMRSEQAEGDDHEITVEVLAPDGRWV